jgi:tetratricopeptide (TPR) repeat protein
MGVSRNDNNLMKVSTMRTIACMFLVICVGQVSNASFDTSRRTTKIRVPEALSLSAGISNAVPAMSLLDIDAHLPVWGVTNWSKAELDSAISNATQMILTAPDEPSLYAHRAVYYACQGQLDKSIEDMSEVIRLAPEKGFAPRGLFHLQQGQYQKAVNDLTEAIRLAPGGVSSLSKRLRRLLFGIRGEAYFEIGELDRAIDDLTEAIAASPDDGPVYVLRGTAYYREGAVEKALNDFEEAARLNPTNALAHYNAACVYHEKGEWENAVKAYTKALLDLAPTSHAYYGRGIAFTYLGKFDQAIADLDKAAELAPDEASIVVRRADAYLQKGEWDKAIQEYNDFLRKEPNDAFSFYCRGYAFNKKLEWNKARRDYAEAVRLDPKLAGAHHELAWLLATAPDASARNGAEAVVSAKKACQLSEWKDWNCIGTLAAAYAESGDFEQAVKYQKQALSMEALTDAERAEEEMRLKLFKQRKPYRDVGEVGP